MVFHHCLVVDREVTVRVERRSGIKLLLRLRVLALDKIKKPIVFMTERRLRIPAQGRRQFFIGDLNLMLPRVESAESRIRLWRGHWATVERGSVNFLHFV